MTVTDDDKRFAGTLIDGARMYAAAADAVNDKLPNALHVLSHLLGMSVELALKAYLKNNGVLTKELRKLGHNLGALYEKAQEFGLAYTGSHNFRLRVLGANYEARIFAYPEESQLFVINPSSLREITHELIVDIFGKIKGEAALQELSEQAGLMIQSEYLQDVVPSAWAVR
ncbi:MAG: hypothetical protein ABSB32_13350 [Thermodesulfobacteriota bacterium]|jgi:hypothetical protein